MTTTKKRHALTDMDEMCVPGGTGITWHEPTHVPMLVDFECVDCGGIGCDCPPPGEDPPA